MNIKSNKLRFISFAFLGIVLSSLTLSARGEGGAKEDFMSNPRNYGGICRVYEPPTEAHTKPPKGYKPFYISTYARHGSRYLHREDYYSDPFDALNNAALEGKLTPLGESVLERVRWMCDEARGRYGDYSPVATEEHRGIAERMFRSYPSIFKGKRVSVYARATGAARVILSMASSTERLKELNPRISVRREGSNAHVELMNEFPVLGRDKIYPECERMIARKLDMDRLKGLLFTDKDYADAIPRLDYAIWRLYLMETNTMNLGYDFDFSDLFSWEDRYVLWEAMNYLMYNSASSSPYNLYTSVPSAWRIVDDFRSCAEAAVSAEISGRSLPASADLRYGHDVYLVSLITLLGICSPYETDPDAVAEVWKDYRITPMAGNIQMVLYRKKGGFLRKTGKEVLVKFLLNEREVSLGSCPKEVRDGVISYYTAPPEPVSGPYYRWSEVEQWLDALSKEAVEMTQIYKDIAKGAYTEDSLPKTTKGANYSVQ